MLCPPASVPTFSQCWVRSAHGRMRRSIDFHRENVQGVPCVSSLCCRYYGLGLATSDFDACFVMPPGAGWTKNCNKFPMIRGQSVMALIAGFRRVYVRGVIGVVRAADVACPSSDIMKRALD